MIPYDHWPPGEYRYDDPYAEPVDRLTHLVLVDGRLVEMWSEPVIGTRWQRYADRFERELRELAAPREAFAPPPPPYEQVLSWLADVCGGPGEVPGLGTAPLSGGDADLPTSTDAAVRQRLEATAALLDSSVARCIPGRPGNETSIALHRALRLVRLEEPDTPVRLKSAAHLAGGLWWAVGKANGLLGAQGVLAQQEVQDALALTAALAGPGRTVQQTLRGLAGEPSRRPGACPDLLPLGRPELLLASTRRTLVRLRDKALDAQAAASPTPVLP